MYNLKRMIMKTIVCRSMAAALLCVFALGVSAQDVLKVKVMNIPSAVGKIMIATDKGQYGMVDAKGTEAVLELKDVTEGIYKLYSAIAQASNLPVILYNVPGRTGVNMKAETTLRLAKEYPNIVAIKEASGNITQMDDIIKNKPADFMVISGDDGITFPLLTLGAVGVISVIGNAFPKEFSKMVRLALNGDFHNALSIHHRFTELFSLLFVDGNPAGVKCLLNAMGYIENKLRLPLVPTRITTYEKIRAVLQSLHYIP